MCSSFRARRTERIEAERSRIYSIRSPLLSRTSRYRALLNLRAIEEILEREQPDLIESGDPYQVGWKAIASGSALRIPVVGFYHSHFPEAYLRRPARYLGRTATEFMMDLARRYVRKIYNQFEATLVPSARLGKVLTRMGSENVHAVDLGVDVDIFRRNRTTARQRGRRSAFRRTMPAALCRPARARRRIPRRCSPPSSSWPGANRHDFICLVVGDGPQRDELRRSPGDGSAM